MPSNIAKGQFMAAGSEDWAARSRSRWEEQVSLEGKGDSLHKVITHDGIESSDNHCCSSVHYWDGRRWVGYPGAD